jgi:hypothetical protein
MPDLLIRNFPVEDLALLDSQAARLGLSRTEYIRRQLQKEARRARTPVSVEDLEAFTETFGDLADDDVISQAWS